MSSPHALGFDPSASPPSFASLAAHCCGPANHAVQFYENDASLFHSVAEFLAEGVRAGEPTLVLATAAHRTGFAARLRALRVDVRGAERGGLLLWLDAHETLARFMRDGTPDRERFRAAIDPIVEAYARRGTGTVRAYGEMVDVLWQQGAISAALRLEELWNEVLDRYDVTLLCAYANAAIAAPTFSPLTAEGSSSETRGHRDVLALHGRLTPSLVPSPYVDRRDPWSAIDTLDGLSWGVRASGMESSQRRALEARIQALLLEQRDAERRLAERERQLADAQRIAGIGSFTFTRDTKKESPADGSGADAGVTLDAWRGELSSELVRLLGSGDSTDVTLEGVLRGISAGNEATVARLRELALEGGVIERQELRIQRADGGMRVCELHAERLDDPDGENTPSRLVGTLLDVTFRRAHDSALQAAQRLEGIGLLAGGIAHDFNNLLGSVLGNADLLCEQLGPDDPARALAEEIRLAAQRSAELTRQLLVYAGKGSVPLTDVDIVSLADDVVALLHSAVRSSGMLCVDRPDAAALRWAVRGDRAGLLQVLLNLVTNAADALPSAGGRVQLRLRFETVDGERLRGLYAQSVTAVAPLGMPRATRFAVVEVADNGCGMSAATRARMFDPFFTTKSKGRGLGLSATLGILRAHRAAMTVDTVEGDGTTIRVYLPTLDAPIRIAPARDDADADVDADAAAERRAQTASRALVADDDELLRGLIARMLRTFGFEVVEAGDGASAVQAFDVNAGAFDIVLLDLTMPELGGVEAMRALRRRSPMLPVLLMSGYGEGAPVVRTRDGEPAVTFISKPFDRGTLRSHLTSALEAATTVA